MRTIVLSADNRYIEPLITTIKSICFHNNNINFYLFNRDFSAEWFEHLNRYLNKMDCHIFDVKVTSEEIKNYRTLAHISSDTTYYRYFISEVINESKVLYLDCDLVVNGNLDALFNVDLENNFIAAVIDNIALNFNNIVNFNAGVLLINNALWKQENISHKAIELSNQYIEQVPDGDQSILNILFENRWLNLNPMVNYLVGAEYYYIKTAHTHLIQRNEAQTPLILHFNTENKPWLPIYDLPFRHYYWYYYQLTWDEIIAKHR